MSQTICKECSKNKKLCGQGFTQYQCKLCREKKHHPNTCVPLICDRCSLDHKLCCECLKELAKD